jgi:hypothetical protein
MDASYSVNGSSVRSKFLVSIVVAAFSHQIKIKLSEQVREGVSVLMFENFAIFGFVPQAIAGRCGSSLADDLQGHLEEAFVADLARRNGLGVSLQQKLRFGGARLKEAHNPAASFGRVDGVWAQNPERVGVACAQKCTQPRFESLR